MGRTPMFAAHRNGQRSNVCVCRETPQAQWARTCAWRIVSPTAAQFAIMCTSRTKMEKEQSLRTSPMIGHALCAVSLSQHTPSMPLLKVISRACICWCEYDKYMRHTRNYFAPKQRD